MAMYMAGTPGKMVGCSRLMVSNRSVRSKVGLRIRVAPRAMGTLRAVVSP